MDWNIRLRITGPIELVRTVEDELRGVEGSNLLVPTTVVANPSEFRLDVGQIAEIISAMSGGVIGAPLVAVIRNVFKRHRGGRIVVESPLGRVVFEAEEELTDEQIREKLDKLTDTL